MVGVHDNGIRLSRNSTQTLVATGKENVVEVGGNDHPTPDLPRPHVVGQTNGQRRQAIADSHLSEGATPGRIPRQWNERTGGKLGRGITGNRSGDDSFTLGETGVPAAGVGDAKYMQHVQIPRGQTVARAFARTVDDSAFVPGVYVSDPTRR